MCYWPWADGNSLHHFNFQADTLITDNEPSNYKYTCMTWRGAAHAHAWRRFIEMCLGNIDKDLQIHF